MKKILFFASIVLLLTGCQSTMTAEKYLQNKDVPFPSSEQIVLCRSYGCKNKDVIKLSDIDLGPITELFTASNNTPESERAQISQAIGLFEKQIGTITGTSEDRAGTYRKWGLYQHDCVDESINTTAYLSLLDMKGYLNFHKVGAPTARVFLTTGRPGPHQTATIIETLSGQKYAVDSWFHDNGHPAEVVDIKKWTFGWRPNKNTHKP
jgi:hypothetical protein